MVTKRISLGDTEETLLLCGEQDSNLKILEKRFGVQIFARSSTLAIRGNVRKVDRAIASLEDLRSAIHFKRVNGADRTPGGAGSGSSAESFGANLTEEKKTESRSKFPRLSPDLEDSARTEETILTSANGRKIRPHSPQQKKYVDLISKFDMVMAVGPAGTGKTFLAVVCALRELHSGKVQRIVLTRPVVEAGEKLGFLPGDFYDKVNPYLKPLYDAFYLLIGSDRFRIYREDETIEIVPLAYMRGRTLENAFVILDEAQNTTPEQMKMFLTRMGPNSKVVITGDITQIDLEFKQKSGFVHSLKVLKDIAGIQTVYFSESDVVRHGLVREILRAYNAFEEKDQGARRE